MPTVFKHTTQTEIGTTPEDVLSIPAGVRATVIGCNIANVTEYDTVAVDVYIINGDSAVSHYVKKLPIPPNTSVKIITNGEKLIIPAEYALFVESNTAASLDVVMSYVEIS